MSRLGRVLVWLSVAAVAFAAVVPATLDHFSFVLPAVWVLFAPVLIVFVARERTRAGEHLTRLQSPLSSRAPPVSLH
jgi:peptidoglycan/LPS O-acetylase OafA/YrhL